MIKIKPRHFAQTSVTAAALCFFAVHAYDAESSAGPAGPGDSKPAVSKNAPVEKARKPGDPITLHLDEVDVRRALELLSRQGSMNILVSPGVSGQVTANLQRLSTFTHRKRHWTPTAEIRNKARACTGPITCARPIWRR
jgi:type II secretory pathway component HofQ